MAISTYAELQTAVVDWLARSDLTAVIPDFIKLAEAGFTRRLRVRAMEGRSTASTVAGQATLALPTDFLEMRNLRLNTDPRRTLLMVPPHQNDWEEPSNSTSGYPRIYKVVGSELVFGRNCSPPGVDGWDRGRGVRRRCGWSFVLAFGIAT